MSGALTIDRLGAQGDGVAETERGPVFVPFTLPGEVVTAAVERDRATLIAVRESSPLRVEPACRHFGTCGGCAVQHMETTAYRAWKREKVVDALRTVGIDAPVNDLLPCAPASRRCLTLTARRTEKAMLLGYRKALSHEIVDIAECPIALPEIVAAFGRLRDVAMLLSSGSKPFRVTVTATASGLDIAFADLGKVQDGVRRAGADLALRAGFARLSVGDEIVVEPRKPVVMFGGVPVTPPPGGFLQTVAASETAMVDLAVAHLAKSKRLADLFCGVGTFTLPLARGAEVHAVEADAPALAALERAARHATGLRRVATERRDLFRRPLTVKELERFDGLIFDPPRAGADDQAKQIAKSPVPRVVAVSCNPTTLARDLKTLVAGGYGVLSVTPLDQFLWSPHVEAVALLERPRKPRR